MKAGSARSCGPVVSRPGRTSGHDPSHGYERYDGILEFAGNLIAPLMHHDRVIGALTAVTRQPRVWTDGDVAFITTLATHAAIALTNAELFAQTEARAAQLAVLQAASARLSRAATVNEVGRTVVEETRRIIDYHNARVYLVEAPDDVVPIAFEGTVGAYEQVDLELLRCRLGEGFTGWVAAARRAAPRPRRERRSARRDDPGHRRGRRVDARRPDALRRGHRRRHHALEARPRPVRRRRPAAAHDPRRPGRDRARVRPPADPQPGPRRRAAAPARHEQPSCRRSLDPRQVAEPHGRPPGARRWASTSARSATGTAPTARVESLGYYPAAPARRDRAPFFDVAGYPETLRVLEHQATVIIDAEDPAADPAEVEPAASTAGNRILAMLPLVAKGQSIGLVELFSKSAVALGRRAARARPDDGQRGGDGPRERAAVRGRPQRSPTATR